MCYSGMRVKEVMTTDEVQELIDSYYGYVQGQRNADADLKRQNEKIRVEAEEAMKRYIESGGTGGLSGTSGISSSTNSHEFISLMIWQVKKHNPHPEWINMWREKFKDDPEVFGWL